MKFTLGRAYKNSLTLPRTGPQAIPSLLSYSLHFQDFFCFGDFLTDFPTSYHFVPLASGGNPGRILDSKLIVWIISLGSTISGRIACNTSIFRGEWGETRGKGKDALMSA